MAIVFQPGQRYFVLTQDQYDELIFLIDSCGDEYGVTPEGLLPDFQLSADNLYCALDAYSDQGPITPQEYTFLSFFGMPALEYIRSTESTYFYPPTSP